MMRAVVLFPTATLPASPITNGAFATLVPRKVAVVPCSAWLAPTWRFSNRESGR